MKIRYSGRKCYLLLALLALLTGPSDSLGAEVVRINGSGSGLDMMKPLVESYAGQSPGLTFVMQKPLGSSGAIKALVAGSLEFAVISRPLRPEEAARGLKLTRYGKTPLAIVVHEKVPLKQISTGELEAIYAGKTKKWTDGSRIRIILRPREDIDTKILKGLSSAMDRAVEEAQNRRGMLIAVTDPESNQAVSRTSGAIGASGLTGISVGKLPVKVVALNGVLPSPQALARGAYPLAKEINFVTPAKVPKAAARFLEFIYSPRGRAIAEKTGVLITSDTP